MESLLTVCDTFQRLEPFLQAGERRSRRGPRSCYGGVSPTMIRIV